MNGRETGPSPEGFAHPLQLVWRAGRRTTTVNEVTPNTRFDADPQQRRFAPLFRAGQSQR
jgi:hypothetical protein